MDPDVVLFRKIREAEAKAADIVREAEARARALTSEAAAASEALLAGKREEFSRRRLEVLAEATGAAEREAAARIEDARVRAERFSREGEAGIDSLVDRLLGMLLPP
jgi:vacuolar-type H+-ATPase subunit H